MSEQATIDARARRENAADLWRAIPSYEGHYEVSRTGLVRSLLNTRRKPRKTPKLIGSTQRVRQGGWSGFRIKVALSKDGIRKDYLVHCLVLLAFVGPRPPGKEACHWDGDPLNNVLENLRWGTPKENSADSARHGTQQRGERCGRSVLNAAAVRRIRLLAKIGSLSYSAIGERYGVGSNAIRKVVHRITWRHVS